MRFLFFFVLIFVACNSNKPSPDVAFKTSTRILSVDSLGAYPHAKIIDVRPPDSFALGHIPNAQNVWRPDMERKDSTIEGLMADKQQMEKLLSGLGILPSDLLVVYDNAGNADALRLWWILYYYGHKNVKLLDGGLVLWKKRGMPTMHQPINVSTTHYVFSNKPDTRLFADLDLMQKAVRDSQYIILDTRSPEEFSGEKKKGNARRAGHIPRSRLLNYDENINYHEGSILKTTAQLAALYQDIPKDRPIITYCQSGVRSALTTFVLTEVLGYQHVKNYDGSWLEWSYHDSLPIETGLNSR